MSHQVIVLPGIVMPAEPAYADLIEQLGDGADARAKELEVYAAEAPPPDYGLGLEIEGVLREAGEAGFERFHLVGYSGGGAIAAACTARHSDRVLSLALLEPAWIGNEGLSESEQRVRAELNRLRSLPPEEMMPAFVRFQLAAGVEPPPPPPGPPPAWMAKRPAGIAAITRAFDAYELELDDLRSFRRPVYYALGSLSNPDYFEAMAKRLAGVFSDYTLDVFDDRHHFNPPHRIEPARLAARLEKLWQRAGDGSPVPTDV